MKKYLTYFGFLFLIMILLYQLKITLGENDLSKTNLSANPITEAFIAEIEILNGCGISGIAELYTNFLRLSKYDIISTDNAKDKHGKINFNYKNCKIIVNNKKKLRAAYQLSLKLAINKQHIIKNYNNGIWDITLIIGEDYNKLNSFKKINKFHEPF